MKKQKIKVAQFIRDAIQEKIKRDFPLCEVKERKIKCPF